MTTATATTATASKAYGLASYPDAHRGAITTMCAFGSSRASAPASAAAIITASTIHPMCTDGSACAWGKFVSSRRCLGGAPQTCASAIPVYWIVLYRRLRGSSLLQGPTAT